MAFSEVFKKTCLLLRIKELSPAPEVGSEGPQGAFDIIDLA